jgi:outer membrane biosynthesis protein TonB
MSMAAARSGWRSAAAATSVMASVAMHTAIIAAFLAIRPSRPPALPPIYRVNIVAAPPGDPNAGQLSPTAPPPEDAAKAPPRPKSDEVEKVPVKVPTRRVPKIATPNVSTKKVERNAPAPAAAGGETGGKGTDVATVRTEGTDFPFPSYLENIVRQIALVFHPPPRGSPLKAEVIFLIRRDGTIDAFRFIQRSGSYSFDLEAQGAVEAAAKRFGRLPAGFHDDVLPVTFNFDPRLIR